MDKISSHSSGSMVSVECYSQRIAMALRVTIGCCDADSAVISLHRDVSRFEEAMIRGITSSASVAELADICCQSSSTFKRHFVSRYSTSPHRWFTEQKLHIARMLVERSSLRTKEISHVCGFSSVSRFIELFRLRYGITPSRLRRTCGVHHDTSLTEIIIEL